MLFLREVEPDGAALAVPRPACAGGRQRCRARQGAGGRRRPAADHSVRVPGRHLRRGASATRSSARKAAADGSAQRPYLGEYCRPRLRRRASLRFAYLPSLSALTSQRLYPKRAAARQARPGGVRRPDVHARCARTPCRGATLKALAHAQRRRLRPRRATARRRSRAWPKPPTRRTRSRACWAARAQLYIGDAAQEKHGQVGRPARPRASCCSPPTASSAASTSRSDLPVRGRRAAGASVRAPGAAGARPHAGRRPEGRGRPAHHEGSDRGPRAQRRPGGAVGLQHRRRVGAGQQRRGLCRPDARLHVRRREEPAGVALERRQPVDAGADDLDFPQHQVPACPRCRP